MTKITSQIAIAVGVLVAGFLLVLAVPLLFAPLLYVWISSQFEALDLPNEYLEPLFSLALAIFIATIFYRLAPKLPVPGLDTLRLMILLVMFAAVLINVALAVNTWGHNFKSDGTPKRWIATRPDGSVYYSTKPGHDPVTGVELKQITVEILKELQEEKRQPAPQPTPRATPQTTPRPVRGPSKYQPAPSAPDIHGTYSIAGDRITNDYESDGADTRHSGDYYPPVESTQALDHPREWYPPGYFDYVGESYVPIPTVRLKERKQSQPPARTATNSIRPRQGNPAYRR